VFVLSDVVYILRIRAGTLWAWGASEKLNPGYVIQIYNYFTLRE